MKLIHHVKLTQVCWSLQPRYPPMVTLYSPLETRGTTSTFTLFLAVPGFPSIIPNISCSKTSSPPAHLPPLHRQSTIRQGVHPAHCDNSIIIIPPHGPRTMSLTDWMSGDDDGNTRGDLPPAEIQITMPSTAQSLHVATKFHSHLHHLWELTDHAEFNIRKNPWAI